MADTCDNCGEEAVTHEVIKDPVTGEYVEHHFCAKCSKEQGLAGHAGLEQPSTTQAAVVRVSAAGLGPCPSCGVTFARFRETGRLGCPSCYGHFEQVIGPMISRAQEGATHHVGKLPKRALRGVSMTETGEERQQILKEVLGKAEERARKLASLRDQLSTALSSERYEQAALIRDQIEQLQSLFEATPDEPHTSGDSA